MPSASLELLSRAQVQALCKERGIKANAKTSVLIQQLKQLSPGASAPPAPIARTVTKTLAPKSTKKSAVIARPNDELELDSASSEDDEMMLGPAPARPSAPSQPIPRKPSASASTSSAAAATARKRVVSSSSSGGLSSSGPAPVHYQTSPNTRATVASLIESVKALQSELSSTKSALSTLQRTAASAPRASLLHRSPPSSPRLTRAQVNQIVDAKLSEHKEEMSSALGPLRARMEANDHWRDMVETSLIEVRQELTAKLTGGRTSLGSQMNESSMEYGAQPTELSTVEEAHSPIASTSNLTPPPAELEASPAYSDAPPPTASLASFSSPSASPRRTSRRSSVAQSPAPALAETPRRSARKSIVPAGSSTALALPPHMVLAASPRRQSGRRSSVSSAAGLESVGSPKSPARLREKLAIGKRARGPSEASEVSVVAQRVVDEEDVVERDDSLVSSRREGHSRKRRRMSAGEALARARQISNEEVEVELVPQDVDEAPEELGPEEVLEEEEELVEQKFEEDVELAQEEDVQRVEEDAAESKVDEAEVDEEQPVEDEAEEEVDAAAELEGETSNSSIIEHPSALDLEPEVDEPPRFEDEVDDVDLSSDDAPIPVESLVHSKIASLAPAPALTSTLDDPFYVASLGAPLFAARKSMPGASVPFSNVGAPSSRRRTLSGRALLDATNSRLGESPQSRKGSLPVTPMAAKTLYGTELLDEDRFDDFGGELAGGATTPGAKAHTMWRGFF